MIYYPKRHKQKVSIYYGFQLPRPYRRRQFPRFKGRAFIFSFPILILTIVYFGFEGMLGRILRYYLSSTIVKMIQKNLEEIFISTRNIFQRGNCCSVELPKRQLKKKWVTHSSHSGT